MKSYVLHISSEKAAASMTEEEGTSICKSNDLVTHIHSLITVKDHIADGPSRMVSVEEDNWRNFFLTPFSLSLEVGLSCPCQLTEVQLLEQRSPALSPDSPPASCCLHCACIHWESAWLMHLSCQYQSNKHGTSQGSAGMVQKLQYNEVTPVVILDLKWLFSQGVSSLRPEILSVGATACKSIVTVRYYIDSCGAAPVSSKSKNANFSY